MVIQTQNQFFVTRAASKTAARRKSKYEWAGASNRLGVSSLSGMMRGGGRNGGRIYVLLAVTGFVDRPEAAIAGFRAEVKAGNTGHALP